MSFSKVILMWASESRLFPFRRSISVADSQDNFAVGVTRFTELVRAAHFRKRQDAIDHRRQLARVNNVRDLCELRAVRLRT